MNKYATRRQEGSALIVSLMILIVMTLIGLTGMGTSSLEEKMAGNTRDMALAFQAAEAALRDGEADYVNNIAVIGAAFTNCTPPYIDQVDMDCNTDVLADGTWATAKTYSGTITGVATQPKYVIELLGQVGDAVDDVNLGGYGENSGLGNIVAARITARGTGGTDNAVIYLQTTYGVNNG